MNTDVAANEVQLIKVYRVCLKAHGLLHSSCNHTGRHGFTCDQTWSLHVTFQTPDMAGHSVCGAQSIHTIPRIVHDETGLNGLPVEDTEPASATYSPLTIGEACQNHNAHVTDPNWTYHDMRLEKHMPFWHPQKHNTTLSDSMW